MNAIARSCTGRDVLVRKLLSLAPAENSCRVTSVMTACREANLTEDELATVVGPAGAAVLGEWSVRYSPDAGRITFAKRSLPSSTMLTPSTGAYDPVEVGQAARSLVETAFADGKELSATEAVNTVLQQRGLRP